MIEMVNQPLPSEGIKQWAADVKLAADEAAQAVVDADAKMYAMAGGGGGLSPEQQAELDALIEQTEQRLEIIREGFLTEDEIAREKLEADLEALQQGFELKLLAEEDYLLQRAMLEEKYMHEAAGRAQELADKEIMLEKQKQAAKLSAASSAFGNLSSLMNTENRKLFEIGKAAAIAQATIDGYQAIQSAYAGGLKISGGNPAVGAAFAATAGIATAVQIAGIASTQFGSKGGVTAGAPGGSTPSGMTGTNPISAQEPQRTMIVQGDFDSASLFSGDNVRRIIDGISEAQQDGYRVVI
jgi:hypothetical protein